MSSFYILNGIIIIGLLISALGVLFFNDLVKSIISLSVVGVFLALEFLLLKAPDVAIAEAAVGAVLTPIIFIITLRKVDNRKKEGQ